MGLGFVDVVDDEGYIGFFECGSQSVGSDIDWDNEVVVYFFAWLTKQCCYRLRCYVRRKHSF
jgi:hypothetical protein